MIDKRRPFQIGERVRFYSGNAIWIANIDAILTGSGLVRASNNGQWFHPKQVRRLVRKPKPRKWTEAEIIVAWNRMVDSPRGSVFSHIETSCAWNDFRIALGIGHE